jgi:hypothetical protein
MIDVSAVQTYHGERDVRHLVDVARENDFIAVHSLPAWTALVSKLLGDRPDIMVGAPVGFPAGAHTTETKRFEARRLIERLWGRMVDGGPGTTWETFLGNEKDSLCHPWGAAPLLYLLGVV